MQTNLVVDKRVVHAAIVLQYNINVQIIAGRIPQDRQARRWES